MLEHEISEFSKFMIIQMSIVCLVLFLMSLLTIYKSGRDIADHSFLAYRKTKVQISFAVTARTAKLISAFVFAAGIVQFLFFLYPKFQASSQLL